MTAGISSTALASPWLNTMRGGGNGVDYTAPAELWVVLHADDPGANGSANPSTGSTLRKQVSLGQSVNGSPITLVANPSWTNTGTVAGATENLGYISVWTSSAGGTFKFSARLATPQTWALGNTFTLTTLYMALLPQAA